MDSIFRCLERLKTRLPDSKEAFLQDLDAQAVIVLHDCEQTTGFSFPPYSVGTHTVL